MEAINLRDNTWRDFTRARSDYCRAESRAKLHLARKQVKRTVKNAKDLWLETMCAEAEQKDTFQAWDAVKTIKQRAANPKQKQCTFPHSTLRISLWMNMQLIAVS